MKEVIAALKARRRVHASWIKNLDALIAKAEAASAGGSGKKAKRRRTRVAKPALPSATTGIVAKLKAAPARPPVKALRAALKANIKKATTPTPANGKLKSGDLFSDD